MHLRLWLPLRGTNLLSPWTCGEPLAEHFRTYLKSRAVSVGEVTSRNGPEGKGPSLYVDDPERNVVELKGPPW